jgi:hypothetical protein
MPSSAVPGISLHDTTLYTKEMLVSLERIASLQQQTRLAELLRAAASEAERLAKDLAKH